MELTKVTILKAIGLALLFIITVVGCHAHFNSRTNGTMEQLKKKPPSPKGISQCDNLTKCPRNVMHLERTFVAFAIICFILSAANLAAGFIMDMTNLKYADGGYQVVAGLIILIAGCVMIAAAVRFDNFGVDCLLDHSTQGTNSCPAKNIGSLSFSLRAPTPTGYDAKSVFRKQSKYADKIAAGCMGFINAVIYFATGFLIVRN